MKEHEFAWWETQGPNVNVKRFKDKYLYIDVHEVFFIGFPCLLYMVEKEDYY